MTVYTSRTTEFCADLAELLAVYRTGGIPAASRRCEEIAATRALAAHENLTLADGFRRAVILGHAA